MRKSRKPAPIPSLKLCLHFPALIENLFLSQLADSAQPVFLMLPFGSSARLFRSYPANSVLVPAERAEQVCPKRHRPDETPETPSAGCQCTSLIFQATSGFTALAPLIWSLSCL